MTDSTNQECTVKARGSKSYLNALVAVISVAALFDFDYLRFLGLGSALYLLQLIAFALMLLLLFINKSRLDAFFVSWVVFCFWMAFCTVFNGQDLQACARLVFKITQPMLLLYCFSDSLYMLFKVLYLYLFVLLALNLVTMILYPDGLYTTGSLNIATENWLLGFKNKLTIYLLPFLIVTFCLIKADGFSFNTGVAISVVLLSAILSKSSTAIVSIAITFLFVFISLFGKRKSLLNAQMFLAVYLVLFILIVLLRFQNLFSFLIVDVLHKDLTFTNRIYLWDVAIGAIKTSPLFGNGYLTIASRHALYTSLSIQTAHDQILEYGFVGGLIQIGLFIGLNFSLARRLGSIDDWRFQQIVSAVYFAALFALLTEVFEDSLFYLIYFLLWFSPLFCSERRLLNGSIYES